MALSQSALLEVLDALKASDSTDVIRQALQVMLQQLIDAEATAFIGAEPHERTDARITQRNGTRSKTITTAAGDLDLSITKLRQGSFFPSLLERRRRIDQALFAVIMEAYVTGTSVRKVDDLVKALGADTGISKSEVSRICADLDEQVADFADRDLSETAFPYVFLDATYCKARVGGARNGKGSRVVSQAIVVATGVSADGRREVLGFAVGDSEDGAFWTAFLRIAEGPRAGRHQAGDLRCPRRAEGRDRRGDARRRAGNGAGCTSCATCSPRCPRAPRRWSPPRSARSSPSPTPSTSATSSTSSPPCSAGSSPRSRRCCARPPRTSPRSPTSRSRTGRRSGRPTRWSGSTRRSNAAPTSSASSPTRTPCCAWPAAS